LGQYYTSIKGAFSSNCPIRAEISTMMMTTTTTTMMMMMRDYNYVW